MTNPGFDCNIWNSGVVQNIWWNERRKTSALTENLCARKTSCKDGRRWRSPCSDWVSCWDRHWMPSTRESSCKSTTVGPSMSLVSTPTFGLVNTSPPHIQLLRRAPWIQLNGHRKDTLLYGDSGLCAQIRVTTLGLVLEAIGRVL